MFKLNYHVEYLKTSTQAKGRLKQLAILSAQEIMELIPNRYPILFMDYVDELEPGESIVATKNVTINEEFFQGHFPGNPVMPGVFIIEALAQTGAVAILSREEYKGMTGYFASWDKIKFRRKVLPGDTLTLKVKMVKQRGKMVVAEGIAYVGEEKAAQGTFTCAIGD